jgi:glucosamine 6-phosphate synthetase-like amidotransferase/phosphosugar isomerase protein
MCQLAAYVGDRPISPLLLRALELQEPLYAGHATGLGVIDEGVLKVVKDSGPVARVRQATDIGSLEGTTGIAHSRYNAKARDDPRYNSQAMAHPFLNDDGNLAMMHNGTIYNYREHWERLREVHPFKSYVEEVDAITDSEVAVHMLSDVLAEGKSMVEAFREVTPQLTGGFLLATITPDEPETVWIANWYQPCVVAVGEDETMFCSSPIGFYDIRDELDRVFEPPRNSILKLTRGKVEVTTMDPARKLYDWKMDEGRAADVILRTVKREKEIDIEKLGDVLRPEGMAEIFGVSPDSFRKEYRQGFRYVNEYFGFMVKLVASGFLKERVDLRTEGGYPKTPRLSYSLD